MNKAIIASVLVFSLPGSASAQAPIRYEISFDNRAHHEAEVSVVFPDLEPGTLELRMSRTSPGRYALHEFAKNVYNFRATDAQGRPLRVTRPDLHQWNVSGHGGEVRIRYTLYGDRADGTYTAIDRSHGHLNMPATFMWARRYEARPVELTIRVPEASGWRVATQLVPTDDPHRFTAPDLAYFLDSPTEVSAFTLRSWSVEGPEGPLTVRMAVHHAGPDTLVDEYVRRARAIVAAGKDVFGELPRFDFGTYTFIACYLPWASGDGMEHRNSTILTSATSLEENMVGLLGTVAHEFFHAWSIERIRPESLEPFDFEAANVSGALWFGEGFTSYYDDLILWRAGILDDRAFGRRLGRMIDATVNAPGRAYFSPVEMSMQAPFVDAAVSVDPTNRGNTFLSYYTWGSAIALGLDLTLRTRFAGVTLDDLMREMWRTHGDPERPYTVDDIEEALARVSGDARFARDFFHRFVRGRDVPDFATLLAAAGYAVTPARDDVASAGPVRLVAGEGGVVLDGATLRGTAWYRAGLDRGDVLTTLDGRRVSTPADVEAVLKAHRPGDRVTLRFRSRGEEGTATLTLDRDPSLRVVERPSPSGSQRAFRASWRTAAGG